MVERFSAAHSDTNESATIAVIIVNYGTPQLAIKAVESVLERNHGGREVEVHLVDNASPGDDAQILSDAARTRGWGARVTLWLEGHNHGFGRGNNVVLKALAAREVSPEFVFLLNPDAQLANETIDILALVLESHPEIAVAGASHLMDDGSEGVSAFRFPGISSEFSAGANLGPVTRLLHRYQVSLGTGLEACQVDWVSGAAFLARFDAMREVGFFNPDYFLYYEEVDLMSKLAEQGWQCWHIPDAKITHVAGAATGVTRRTSKPSALPVYWYESWRLYFCNRYTRTRAIVVALSRLAGWSIGGLVNTIRRKPRTEPRFARDFVTHVLAPLCLKGACK